MATYPDTPDIADRADVLGATEAATRLRALHQLGATDEALANGLRAQLADRAAALDTVTAERDTLTTERDALVVERDALQAQLDALTSTTGEVPIVAFRARLLGLRLALLGAPDPIKAKWGVILPELDILRTVLPNEQPVSGLIDMALADGLIDAAGAALLRQVG